MDKKWVVAIAEHHLNASVANQYSIIKICTGFVSFKWELSWVCLWLLDGMHEFTVEPH